MCDQPKLIISDCLRKCLTHSPCFLQVQQGVRRAVVGGLVAVEVGASGRMTELASLTDRDGVPRRAEGVLILGDSAYFQAPQPTSF